MKFLVKDYLGRWSICGKEYTCGNSVTAKITSGEGAEVETCGRIEYSDSRDDYYFISGNGQLIKSMTDITVKEDKVFLPLVKNSCGRWQVKEQTLKEGSKLYIYLEERNWQLCIVKFDKERAEYYAVTVNKFNNKNLYFYLDEYYEPRTVEEQEEYLRQAHASEEEAV